MHNFSGRRAECRERDATTRHRRDVNVAWDKFENSHSSLASKATRAIGRHVVSLGKTSYSYERECTSFLSRSLTVVLSCAVSLVLVIVLFCTVYTNHKDINFNKKSTISM